MFLNCVIFSMFQLLEIKNELKNLIENLKEGKCSIWDPDLPVIYAITPTYTRLVQEAELTRSMVRIKTYTYTKKLLIFLSYVFAEYLKHSD